MNEIKPSKTAEELSKEVEIVVKNSQAIVVLSQDDYNETQIRLKSIKVIYKALEEERKKATIPLDETKKIIMDWFRRPLEALVSAEKTIKDAILVFYRKEEEKRQAQEKRLRELQEKETERLRRRAEKAEEKGQIEKAEELKEQIEIKENIVPIVTETFEKAKGIATKTIWKFKIVNTDLIPRQFLIPDEKKISDIAQASKGTFELPGVQFYPEEILSVRT